MKNKYITTIEFTDRFTKVIQAELGGNGWVTYMAARENLDKSDEELVSIIAAMLTACPNRSHLILVVVPRRLAIMKQLSLPSLKEEELREMVKLSVDQHTPYGRSEVYCDYALLEKDLNGYSKIMATYLQKDILKRYLKILDLAQLNPARITLSSYGLAGLIHGQGMDLLNVALLNIESFQSEICLCHGENLLFSRILKFGWADWGTDQGAALVREIILTLNIYQKEKMGGELNKIFILPNGQDLSSFQRLLSTHIKFPIVVFNDGQIANFKNVMGRKTKSADQISFSGLGLILNRKGRVPNLTSVEFIKTQNKRARNRILRQCAFILMILIILNTLIFGIELFQGSMKLKKMRNAMKEIEPESGKLEMKMNQVQFLKNWISGRIDMVEFLAQIHEQIPAELSIDHLNVDRDKFEIEGIAKPGSYLNNFQDQLIRSATFQNVILQYATNHKISRENVTFFKFKGQVIK